MATEVLGASVIAAYEAAQDWLESLPPEPSGVDSDTESSEGGPVAESGSTPQEDQTL